MDAVTLLSPGGDRSLPPGQPALQQPNSLHPRAAAARSRASAVHISPRRGKVSFCSSPPHPQEVTSGSDAGAFWPRPSPMGLGSRRVVVTPGDPVPVKPSLSFPWPKQKRLSVQESGKV